MELHGFDARDGFWHGPLEVDGGSRCSDAISRRLRRAGGNFHGKVDCSVPGSPALSFHNVIYNLHDSGLALIDLESARGGPTAVVSVIPAGRRGLVRADFAFAFLSFLQFSASYPPPGSDLLIHDYVENALKSERGCSLAFAVESSPAEGDTSIVLAAYIESLSMAMERWLAGIDAEVERAACA